MNKDVRRSPGHILVTGGRGRIASVLIPHLRGCGYRVTAVSRVKSDETLEYDGLFEMLGGLGPDVVIHSAWSTVPVLSERNPGIEWQVDLPLLARLLSAICSGEPRPRPYFVFLSSAGTLYGNNPSATCTEDTPVCPVGWHGRAKLAAEILVQHFAESFGLPALILRVSNPYGQSWNLQRPQGIIPLLIRAALESTIFHVWGDGTQSKDFIYIDDLLEAFDKIIERRVTGIRNLTCGQSTAIRDVIQLVESSAGKKIPLAYEPPFAWDASNPVLSSARLQAEVDWKPRVSLEEGIRRQIQRMAG